MKNIEGAAGLAKRAINRICFDNWLSKLQWAKASYLITTEAEDTFSVSWCLVNSLDTR